jgi:hypothetical protein
MCLLYKDILILLNFSRVNKDAEQKPDIELLTFNIIQQLFVNMNHQLLAKHIQET